MADRIGRQEPTLSVILPYQNTEGMEAIDFYESTGRSSQQWQTQMPYDILAVNKDGLWVHTKFGYAVPRRNGKGEIITIREMHALTSGERVIHTAHRTSTSSSAAYRLAKLIKAAGYKEVIRPKKDETYEHSFTFAKQFGLERITLLDTGGTVDFRTRTSKGGLGEGFDLLIVDEAQEYTDDQQSTLQYVVSDSANPQIILCGTPPTAISSGTVFEKLRYSCLGGKTEDTGWAEWSVEKLSDCNDVELWYETNPALGKQLKERNIRNEDKTDNIDFNIQRFGYWTKYNLKSAISKQEWIDLRCKSLPEIENDIFVGIKYGHDGENVCMGVSVKTKDGKRFVECIDCQPVRAGTSWIINYLKSINPKGIVVDGDNGRQILEKDMKDAGIKKRATFPTIKDVVSANTAFETSLETGVITHNGQPSLEQAVSNCEKRVIGSNGGWGYKSLKDGVEIALLESVILADWACVNMKVKKKQKICY